MLQTAASGGDILIDGTTVWLIPYNTGSGTLAPSLAGVTIGAVTCNTIGLYSAMNVAPVISTAAKQRNLHLRRFHLHHHWRCCAGLD